MNMEIIEKYFPELDDTQRSQFRQLYDLYADWNQKINVISRKDIENLYERHVLHSLGIAKVITFAPGTKIMDLGCGGGFPGIPLAILNPQCQFHLVDSIGKKVKVAQAVSESIGLKNATCFHARAEEMTDTYDYIVTRAVMPMQDLLKVNNLRRMKKGKGQFSKCIFALKGGELEEELEETRNILKNKGELTVWNLSDIFEEEFFQTKKVVRCQYR